MGILLFLPDSAASARFCCFCPILLFLADSGCFRGIGGLGSGYLRPGIRVPEAWVPEAWVSGPVSWGI